MSKSVVPSPVDFAAAVLIVSLSSTAWAADKLSKEDACRIGKSFIAKEQSAYPKNRNFQLLSCTDFKSIPAQGTAQIGVHWSVEEYCPVAGCEPQYTKQSNRYTCRFYVGEQGWQLNSCD